ncbi:MAG: DUF3365 domain-containing protein [Nitrospirota bacterium]|nr:DUF3365 domain-containing protein [Nitrospirota bacterium]
MDNKPLLWVLGGASFAFVAVITYWVFALTLANQMKADLVPPAKAASYIHALIEANRKNYTENVVDKLRKAGLAVAIEHWRDEKGVPLPAQFLLESGRLVAQKDLKFTFRLASMTPIYVWNGATTDFERKGLDTVTKDPSKPFGGFVRLDGGRYYQTIYPDLAVAQSCVTCHNEHPNSPRRDYKVGDVMGGIIITIPIDIP